MYRIGNDKRKKQSAALICKGLEELMKKNTYENITITHIIEASGVGRATFYRLFDDKYDILIYQMETVISNLILQFDSNSRKEDIIKTLFDTLLIKKQLFLTILEANLYGELQIKIADMLEEKLRFIHVNTGLDERRWQYFLHIRTAMILEALHIAITQYEGDDSACILTTMEDLFGKQDLLPVFNPGKGYEKPS